MEKGINFSIFSKGPIIPVKIIENPNIVMVKFPKKNVNVDIRDGSPQNDMFLASKIFAVTTHAFLLQF